MNVTINASELKELLKVTSDEQNIMLTGRHGIGKSEILTGFFESRGMKVQTLFLGQMADPGDLIGLPTKNEQLDRTTYSLPFWFPKDNEPIVLFLDELNRARPEILQTIMDLALNKKLAGKTLPKGSRIISAVNEGDQYQLTDLDPALVSRFNIYNFIPSTQEWLLWAKQNNVDERIINFISENSLWLDGTPDMKECEDTGLEKTPDRRAWKKVSDIIKGRELDEFLTKVIAGVVGQQAVSALLDSTRQNRTVSAKAVITNFEKHKDRIENYEVKDLTAVTDSIFRLLEVEKVPESKVKTACDNIEAYFDLLTRKSKESASYFAELYSGNTYPHTNEFLASNAPMLIYCISLYVKNI